MNFWQKLVKKKKPFFALAPMADVTDPVFRQVILKCGKPDVLWTEFVSVDGLSSNKGYKKLIRHLKFSKKEKPIVVQFFGTKPENFYKCAQLAVKLGFDGIDINMGCPVKKVAKQGAGAKLISNSELAKEIIIATKRGAGSGSSRIPVSVKTRIGFNKIDTKNWISEIIRAKPDAITVHGRTSKELSMVPAHWDEIAKATKLIKKAGIVAIGNGDVLSVGEGMDKAKRYGVDGIMIGRGIFQNPWVFSEGNFPKGIFDPALSDEKAPFSSERNKRIKLALYHLKLHEKFWGKERNYDNMKKFFKMYISGWEGAKELRMELMITKSATEAFTILTRTK
ncbi:MAG: tRNA-dihydrouridine synthase [Candidatus Yanofskybacteria bacterium GW2011_GWF1_44_227]|uniref:tRNA-dihydrouridine synthase n=1 Tax=Candidatus Yanofskybacteria bacterium GW2011_GWE2_40_11 TaxID=1619033 RepID=A0A0G0T254_9BACT|nr:MAG: tRNA-dihydrouridine synthase [Candidatus Yanofskybacteria bacterium GW2011_GWE1_40_10]KKR41170.1 MAG: tRNA-dihydrouridine synthase [Candidatus Yanofskybacteria bacterium GW2011_GWE2_40_11]KKT15833.1 MAG: tRNA-dihydrouridine synthase [Candidatus Yanofskybacteria bacterium GW2011_GWF2_43_596]KKT53654.1 MAG: tRNA-dihydrouridine synthase [Candidatus Yanofskybacteria bacterium GW2011_GWF1_44_227]OGN36223.1 MAG: hypothetical protein A2241_00555 [Candidatus Yanofskybacteria bacterium RIFOXYA2_